MTYLDGYVTDEPAVTAATRFWLFSEISSHRVTTTALAGGTPGINRTQRHRIDYEVNEDAYRAAHRESCHDYGDDISAPLDSHWWNSRLHQRIDGWDGYTNVDVTRGGFIEWWGR